MSFIGGDEMSQLDPEVEYLLDGQKDLPTSGLKVGTPPKVLQVRLSASLLEAILVASKDADKSPTLSFADAKEAVVRVQGGDHHLQQSIESSPHQLYSIASGSRNLKLIGNIVSKLHDRQDGNGSSSATAASKLKERRELEEARKSEHRTVLIDSPLLGESKSKGSSKLKLRPKGLAPSATNSPLIRSRAGTPAESSSVPASPTFQPNQLPAKTPPSQSPSLPSVHANPTKPSPLSSSNSQKRTISPTSLRRRLLLTLAKGPLSRRDLVQQSQLPESGILSLLDTVADVAPDHMQIPKENVKKYSGPINRRSSTQSYQAVLGPGKGEKGPGTVYVLKDALYREVMSEDWVGYSDEDVLRVSEYAEAALKRQKIHPNAEEWKKLYPRGRRPAPEENTDTNGQDLRRRSSRHSISIVEEKDTDMSSSQNKSPKKTGDNLDQDLGRAVYDKNSVFNRINKAAMGKNLPVTSRIKTATSISTTKSSRRTKTQIDNVEEKVARRSLAAANLITKAGIKGKGELTSKGLSRKDIEYTDSSESNNDEIMQLDDQVRHQVPKKASPTRKMAKSSSEASDGYRQRRGVGSGAAFTSEPWLDVRNRSDWNRLAERFKRVYEEYSLGRTKLCEEEKMIKSELELAQSEQTSANRNNAKKSNERKSSLQNDNDAEEGEASPTNTSNGMTTSADPILYHNVIWRQNKGRALDSDRGQVNPMSIEELQLQIRRIQEMENQLNRMKGTLKSARRTLQSVVA